MLKVTKQTSKNRGYVSSDVSVYLEEHDTDINVVLPNGSTVSLQFRMSEDEESYPTLDVLLPEHMHVHNWRGEGMKPAKTPKGQGKEVHDADQLMIPLPPDSFLSPVADANARPEGIFIVAPTDQDSSDTLYEVYRATVNNNSLSYSEIYARSLCKQIETFGSLEEAKAWAKKTYGKKRTFVLK